MYEDIIDKEEILREEVMYHFAEVKKRPWTFTSNRGKPDSNM